jgi:hypothetical protein
VVGSAPGTVEGLGLYPVVSASNPTMAGGTENMLLDGLRIACNYKWHIIYGIQPLVQGPLRIQLNNHVLSHVCMCINDISRAALEDLRV